MIDHETYQEEAARIRRALRVLRTTAKEPNRPDATQAQQDIARDRAIARLLQPLTVEEDMADLLDALDTNTDPTAAARRVRDAIKEATP